MRMRVVLIHFNPNTAPVLTGHRENAVSVTEVDRFHLRQSALQMSKVRVVMEQPVRHRRRTPSNSLYGIKTQGILRFCNNFTKWKKQSGKPDRFCCLLSVKIVFLMCCYCCCLSLSGSCQSSVALMCVWDSSTTGPNAQERTGL